MREIKFRGKTKNGRWLVGELLSLNSHKYIAPNDGDWFDFIEWVPENLFHAPDSDKYEVDINTIGQFTGLQDSVGREIYEGDIIKSSHGTIHYIVYDDDLACFKAVVARYNPSNEYSNLSKGWIACLNEEVIGNIHDNQ